MRTRSSSSSTRSAVRVSFGLSRRAAEAAIRFSSSFARVVTHTIPTTIRKGASTAIVPVSNIGLLLLQVRSAQPLGFRFGLGRSLDLALVAQGLDLRRDVVAAVGDDALEHSDAVAQFLDLAVLFGRPAAGILARIELLYAQPDHFLPVVSPHAEEAQQDSQDRNENADGSRVHMLSPSCPAGSA